MHRSGCHRASGGLWRRLPCPADILQLAVIPARAPGPEDTLGLWQRGTSCLPSRGLIPAPAPSPAHISRPPGPSCPWPTAPPGQASVPVCLSAAGPHCQHAAAPSAPTAGALHCLLLLSCPAQAWDITGTLGRAALARGETQERGEPGRAGPDRCLSRLRGLRASPGPGLGNLLRGDGLTEWTLGRARAPT